MGYEELVMRCPCCETENPDDAIYCAWCKRPFGLKPDEIALWHIENKDGQIRGMYKGTIERFGFALKIVTGLTGVTLFLTGLSNAVKLELHPSSGDWVLMLGGIVVGASLFLYWPYIEWKNKKKGV
ncbi:MAG: zinc ribbon domain-containing protein [Candidatus Thermoplasmatota archaeon]|nr:zinc ribbon domain-containing protein [Candidatus Thermoplasmatota archaeon]